MVGRSTPAARAILSLQLFAELYTREILVARLVKLEPGGMPACAELYLYTLLEYQISNLVTTKTGV